MKCIIFEGPDRTGKDSYIADLASGLRNYTVRHWSYPQGETNEQKTQWQKNSFVNEFVHYSQSKLYLRTHTFFWNRSHIGEMVWGQLYRDSRPETWVMQLEDIFGFAENPDIYLVHLTADPVFLTKQDDGNSYSNELEKKCKEVEAFEKAVASSCIMNKITIRVNNNQDYHDFNELKTKIRSFLGF